MELSAARHEELATRLEAILRKLLVTDNYDSVSNFISLHDAHDRSKKPLYDVYEEYVPPIRKKKHTCVGLALELVKRWRGLERLYPGLGEATALASCEEAVERVREYVAAGGPHAERTEKEHVMAAVLVRVGGRPGALLADPGYHVPRVVTVMLDRAYPHTGTNTTIYSF